MLTRISLAAVLSLLAVSLVQADVFRERWNDAARTNSDWQYWGSGSNASTRPGEAGQNYDMDWSATGGVAKSGHVWSQSTAWVETWDRLWPAYMAPPDYVAPVSLAGQDVSISVNDFGSVAALPGGVELRLHFFIGEWLVNGADPADDTYAFFQHTTVIGVGDNTWATTHFAVGDDSNWTMILRNPGSTKTASDLFDHPQQWGFVLDDDVLPDGIRLGFDELEIVPEPSGLLLMSLAMLGTLLTPWLSSRARFMRTAGKTG